MEVDTVEFQVNIIFNSFIESSTVILSVNKAKLSLTLLLCNRNEISVTRFVACVLHCPENMRSVLAGCQYTYCILYTL